MKRPRSGGPEHRQRRRPGPTLLPRVLLAASCLLGASVHADTTPAPTPWVGPTPAPTAGDVTNRTLADVTPDRGTLLGVLAADAAKEVATDEDVTNVAAFEWATLDEASPAPFLLCAGGERDGAAQLLAALPRGQAQPLAKDGEHTCFLAYAAGELVRNLTTTLPDLDVATPLPPVFKAARGLFGAVNSGRFLEGGRLCAGGLRVVLAPGVERQKGRVPALVRRVRSDLRTGAYLDAVRANFYWVAANETLVAAAAASSAEAGADGSSPGSNSFDISLHSFLEGRRRLAQQRGREQQRLKRRAARRGQEQEQVHEQEPAANEEHPPATELPQAPAAHLAVTPRGRRWQERVQQVLDGAVACDFAPVTLGFDGPYGTLGGLCELAEGGDLEAASSCMIALLAYVTTFPAVAYVEPFPPLRLNNWDAAGISQSGDAYQTPFYGSVGLTGEGQVVGVSDTGLDLKNCYFSDPANPNVTTTWADGYFDPTARKVVQYVNWIDSGDVQNGHGTHVSGTIAGYRAGTAIGGQGSFNGLAPAAKIAFYDIGDASGRLTTPSNLVNRLFPPGWAAGARVFSISWGTALNTYTYLDVQIDQFMYRNREGLVIIAVGNSGTRGARTVFSPALTKNGICVGASLSVTATRAPNISSVAYFSGQGPTLDGRIKPDLVAPGSIIISAAGNTTCGTVGLQGTSMAAPVVAALAAQVRQYFMEGRYPSGAKNATADAGFAPSGALVKAVLITSCVRMHQYTNISGQVGFLLGPPPDMVQGFGRPLLSRVLRLAPDVGDFVGPSLHVEDDRAVATGETHTYKLTVPNIRPGRIRPFEVTLAWTDPDTTAQAATQLLHNLDLTARVGEGPTHWPNNRDGPDVLNNLEKVRVAQPAPGDVVTLTVTGASVTFTGVQNYSLAAAGTFVAAAWYCVDPRAGRLEEGVYKTEYCAVLCGDGVAFAREALCCRTGPGNTACTPEEADATEGACDRIIKPWDCFAPTPVPTPLPTETPTRAPTQRPTRAPTQRPTRAPTRPPTRVPTQRPTRAPTTPSIAPTNMPVTTAAPTTAPPTPSPSLQPSAPPIMMAQVATTPAPTTRAPTRAPSRPPTRAPSVSAKATMTTAGNGTAAPTRAPTRASSRPPTRQPSVATTVTATTASPTATAPQALTEPQTAPLATPVTAAPTKSPTRAPTRRPTTTRAPTRLPTRPTGSPSTLPTTAPSQPPTRAPTRRPTVKPPTKQPTRQPTVRPPTKAPTVRPPTKQPTRAPSHAATTASPTLTAPVTAITTTAAPTKAPTRAPTVKPPTKPPTKQPSKAPTQSPS